MVSSVFYAVLGVGVAELLLQGISLELAKGPAEWIDDGAALGLFFVISVVFLEPVSDRIRRMINPQQPKEPSSALLWGMLGLGIALIFLLLEEGIEMAIQHSPLGSLLLFLLLLFVPGIVTLAWIAGVRRGRRAALYGALAGFATDAIARGILWWVTGSVLADFRAPPDAIGTAVIAALAGGVQAGFYAGCGGLALDWIRSNHPVRFLSLTLFSAILLWTIGYRLFGSAVGLAGAGVYGQLNAFIIRFIDYGGWMLGLSLCPQFGAALHRERDSYAQAAIQGQMPC